jgi:hypothetical protein
MRRDGRDVANIRFLQFLQISLINKKQTQIPRLRLLNLGHIILFIIDFIFLKTITTNGLKITSMDIEGIFYELTESFLMYSTARTVHIA